MKLWQIRIESHKLGGTPTQVYMIVSNDQTKAENEGIRLAKLAGWNEGMNIRSRIVFTVDSVI